MWWTWLGSALGATVTVGPAQTHATIQAGVDAAADGDVVEIHPGTYSESVDLGWRTLDLVGVGGPIVQATAAGPAFDIVGGTVTLTDLKIDGQLLERAVYTHDATVTLDGVHAHSGADPLATDASTVYADGGVLDAVDCLLEGGASSIYGGVVGLDKTEATLRGATTIRGGEAWYGGGLYIDGSPSIPTPVTLSDTVVIEDNVATVEGGGMNGRWLALHATGATFRNNTAPLGGGAYFYAYDSAWFEQVLFEGNTADGGGGIYLWEEDDLVYADFHFCTFDGNTATDVGGAMFLQAENTVIDDSVFTGNAAVWDGIAPRAVDDFRLEAATPQGSGGAIFHAELDLLSHTPELWIHRSDFVGNVAGEDGGAIATYDPYRLLADDSLFDGNSANRGGAIKAHSDTTTSLRWSTFQNNTATDVGGAVMLDSTSFPELVDSVFDNNAADTSGGGVYALGGFVEVFGGVFVSNTAPAGGAIHTTSSFFDAFDVHFEDNVATTGAAILADAADDDHVLERLTICGHDDPSIVTALELSSTAFEAEATVRNLVFAHNAAGGLLVDSHTVLVDHATIVGNDSDVVFDGVDLSATHVLTAYNTGINDWLGLTSAGWNLWWSNTAPWTISQTDVVSDPLLLDATTADCDAGRLRLGPGSPAIDAGDPARTDDDATLPDIGAFGGAEPHTAPEPPEFACAPLVPAWADGDNDGVGAGPPRFTCSPPPGWVLVGGDCDDADPNVGAPTPGYLDLDGDGDGSVRVTDCAATGLVPTGGDCDDDDATIGTSLSWYRDDDDDGYGAGPAAQACTAPTDHVAVDGDCDDTDAQVNPESWWYDDADGDGFGDPTTGVQQCVVPAGYVADDTDCDDADPAIHPDTRWYRDSDLDGYGSTTFTIACDPGLGFVLNDTDCDDADPDEHPGATWYLDGDGDGWGDDATEITSCEHPGGGRVADGGDCDDMDPAVNPGTPWWPDADGDGYGDPFGLQVQSCTAPPAYAPNPDDCNDAEPTWNPDAVWAPDADGDGYGDMDRTTASCAPPGPGAVADTTDCDDTDPTVNPGATEVLDNGIDEDCDGTDATSPPEDTDNPQDTGNPSTGDGSAEGGDDDAKAGGDGCGCTSTPGSLAGWPALLLVGLLARRRARL